MKPPFTTTRAASILLVDDNAARRKERAVVLVTNGYDVQCAANLADAQRQSRIDKPDLLLIAVTHVGGTPSAPDADVIENAQQLVGFLLNEGQELCAVHFDGKLLLPREGPHDFVARVALLLDRGGIGEANEL